MPGPDPTDKETIAEARADDRHANEVLAKLKAEVNRGATTSEEFLQKMELHLKVIEEAMKRLPPS